MIIQASHLNFNYMQKVQEQQDGKTSALGFGASAGLAKQKAKTEVAPQLSTVPKAEKQDSQIQDRVDVFGDLMGRYLQGFQQPADDGQEGESKDPTALVSSLKDTVRWVEDQYGKDAATAAMGMIVQSASRGQSEEAIGDGLLNVLKMVDRNFGIAAGDAAIAKFNSGVNKDLNAFFDNGSQEVFFAAESSSTVGEAASLTSRVLTQAQQAVETDKEEVDPTKELLDALINDIMEEGGIPSAKEELDEAAKQQGMQQAMAAYTSMPAPDAQLLSMSI
ncbi:hypothetical protein [Salidesulfovibrio onnuriiensis]|uniref:hypothetical protein n=1 Tax=Salidesulfovibrio onnuriiensis TaxID=2583823 RepID=UPI0011CB9CCE|nr:hypothetical protein [Salidesulfovibrio onnuriiensis]